jgi:hypothetical protein
MEENLFHLMRQNIVACNVLDIRLVPIECHDAWTQN